MATKWLAKDTLQFYVELRKVPQMRLHASWYSTPLRPAPHTHKSFVHPITEAHCHTGVPRGEQGAELLRVGNAATKNSLHKVFDRRSCWVLRSNNPNFGEDTNGALIKQHTK